MYYSFPLCTHQTDAQHLKVSAGADRSRHKWELRMQDSHVVEIRGSWEQRKDLMGSVFYFCKSEEGLPEPFRWDFLCPDVRDREYACAVRPRQNSNERGTARGRVVCHVFGTPPTQAPMALDRGEGLPRETRTVGNDLCQSVFSFMQIPLCGRSPVRQSRAQFFVASYAHVRRNHGSRFNQFARTHGLLCLFERGCFSSERSNPSAQKRRLSMPKTNATVAHARFFRA